MQESKKKRIAALSHDPCGTAFEVLHHKVIDGIHVGKKMLFGHNPLGSLTVVDLQEIPI